MPETEILISSLDKARLTPLLDSARLDARIAQANLALLEREVGRATVRPPQAMPADVVAMHSRVAFVDLASGEVEQYTLVYPNEADMAQNRISVLAPIGTALLGYRVGDVVQWQVPAGSRQLQITSVESPQALVAESILRRPAFNGAGH